MYECFNCCKKAVVWDSDYDFEDFGYEGAGIVHICHCSNCKAEIEYRVPVTEEDIEELKEGSVDNEKSI
jgi:hypothetical protein